MIEAKVKNNFNDKTNNFKKYKIGQKYICDKKRYKDLFSKGFLDHGKELKENIKEKKED